MSIANKLIIQMIINTKLLHIIMYMYMDNRQLQHVHVEETLRHNISYILSLQLIQEINFVTFAVILTNHACRLI